MKRILFLFVGILYCCAAGFTYGEEYISKSFPPEATIVKAWIDLAKKSQGRDVAVQRIMGKKEFPNGDAFVFVKLTGGRISMIHIVKLDTNYYMITAHLAEVYAILNKSGLADGEEYISKSFPPEATIINYCNALANKRQGPNVRVDRIMGKRESADGVPLVFVKLTNGGFYNINMVKLDNNYWMISNHFAEGYAVLNK